MEESPLQFARPLWLYAAPAAVLLMLWLFAAFDRRRRRDLARLAHPRFQARLTPGFSPRLRKVRRGLWLTALAMLFLAAAGPRMGFELREVKRRGIDILFAVDTSRSMLAEDLSPNRLERARLGIHDFASRLQGDRVGLIPFAGNAFPLCPLTGDYQAFRESLEVLDTDLIPHQGTDVATAIREADRLFDEESNHHRILILITDGEDLQGDAVEAARESAKKGTVIYPVGVGSTEGVTIPVTLANGRRDVVRDQSGQPVITRLDESTLRQIAEATKGLYVAMGRGAEGLEAVYREKLRMVPKSEFDSRTEKIPLERYAWPLSLAVFCLVMELLLPDRKRRPGAGTATVPPPRGASPPQPLQAGSAVMAAAVLAWGAVPSSRALAADTRILYNQGTEAYAGGRYQEAADRLKESLSTSDLALQNRAYYNLGNALYRLGQEDAASAKTHWEAAVKAWEDAIALNPDDHDARYNRDLVKHKLDNLKKQDPPQQDQDKKDRNDEENQEKEKNEGDQKGGEQKDPQEKNGDSKEEKKDGGKSGTGEQPQPEQQGSQPQDQQSGDGQSQQEGGSQQDQQPPSGQPSPESGKEGESPPDKPQDGRTGGASPDSDPNQKQGAGESGRENEAPTAGEEKEGGAEQPGAAAGGEKKDGAPEKPESATTSAAGGEKETASGEEPQQGTPPVPGARRKAGGMSPQEAAQLLRMMSGEERTVVPIERPRRASRFLDPNNTTRGKTW